MDPTYFDSIGNSPLPYQYGDLQDGHLAKILAYFLARKKILFIKTIRSMTGWGLKESKDFVDKLAEGVATKERTESANKWWNALTDEERRRVHDTYF